LATVTTGFPPVYYPIAILPPALRGIALAFPTVSLMEVGRWIAGGRPYFHPLIPTIVTLSWLGIIAFAVAKKLKWGLE